MKRALLVGINRYRMAGADLRGCVNDVENLKSALVDLFGFVGKNIKTLTDFAATQKNMQREMQKLVASGKAGDVLVLHYSGHGSNVPDNDGDEADKRDEILCPTDLDWKNPFRDDWLRTLLDGLAPGVNLTVIMDCCHSGSNTRALLPPDAPRLERYLPSPWDLVAVESGRALRGTVTGGRAARRKGAPRKQDVVVINIPETLVTGCRDTQTSADAYIKGSYNGALTYHLVKVLRDAKGKVTYRELHARTIELLKKGKYDQVPQLEGRAANLDRLFLAPLA